MDIISIAMIILAMGTAASFLLGMYQTFNAPQPVNRRLEQIARATASSNAARMGRTGAGGAPSARLAEEEEKLKASRRADLLPLVSKILSRQAFLSRLQDDLNKARSRWRASEIAYASFMIMLVVMVIVGRVTSGNFVVVLLAGLPALFIPYLYVKRVSAQWQNAFSAQLSDTLGLMANALRSGYSFMQAIDLIGQDNNPPISDEFMRISQEINLGISVEQAMENFGKRINSVDVDLLVTAVLIQREVGGALAEILDTIADTIRERVRIKGEIRTITTQGRYSGYGLAMLPVLVGLALFVIQRDPLMKFFHDRAGQIAMGVGLVMYLIGFYTINKIVTIDI